MDLIKHTEHILEIDSFWTPKKCDEFIAKSELIGYESAMIQTENGQKLVESVRNNQRILFTDFELAENIWNDVKKFTISKLGNSKAIGLNEMFRFYKYELHQTFKKHRDQSYIRNASESSYYTLLIYLNDNFVGGETIFGNLKIQPKKGNCLIFFHDLEHEGAKLVLGEKYILRTDIMYKLEE